MKNRKKLSEQIKRREEGQGSKKLATVTLRYKKAPENLSS